MHRPLRIWMINQRSKYPSRMTQQRWQALEEIHFPRSGRFRNRIDELQYEKEQQMKLEQFQERELRNQQRELKERERINAILSRRNETKSLSSSAAISPVRKEHLDDVLMALWSAEDEE